jgi:uncharacterized membrane-anchored protein YhcB (DUF1043 family)
MIANYVRLVVFALGLLVGIQVPGFVDQYAKRVSAHQIEVARNFRGFQETADRYFSGNVEALIAHHIASTDPPFKDEARSIRETYQRLTVLTAELAALRGPLIQQIVHVLLRPNKEILDETWSEYTYTVPLNAAAVVCGVSIGALLAMLVEALLTAGVRLLRPRRTSAGRAIHHH